MELFSCLILFTFCLQQCNLLSKIYLHIISFFVMTVERGLNDEGWPDVPAYIGSILIIYMVAAVGYVAWTYPIVSRPEPKFSACRKQKAMRNHFRHRNLSMRHATLKARRPQTLERMILMLGYMIRSCLMDHLYLIHGYIVASNWTHMPETLGGLWTWTRRLTGRSPGRRECH